MNCNTEKQVVFCCLSCRKIQRLCKARAEAKFTWIMPSRRQRCIYMNVYSGRLIAAKTAAPIYAFFYPEKPSIPVTTAGIKL